MLIRLISLVILFIFINVYHISLADINSFLYPKKKPFVSLNKSEVKNENDVKILLPSSKPLKKEKLNVQKKIFVLPQEKPTIRKKVVENDIEKIQKKVIKKEEITNQIVVNKFLYPKKKPKTYKSSPKSVSTSSVLSKKDFTKAKDVFNYIKARKWNSALKLSKRVKNKDFKNLITWMYLKTNNNQATFNDYANFIKDNEDYPRISRLRYLAEKKIILKNTTPDQVINWFSSQEPYGGTGKLKLAEAYLSKGETSKAIDLIKTGWINADLSKSDLRFYRNKFKNFLNSEDQINRADYLAWNRKYWDLKRMLRYLPKDKKALYNARQILMSNSYGVDKAISEVPTHLKNDIGLQYDRLKWRNRRGRLNPSLEILNANANKSEKDLVRADLWWKQRESIVRSLIYKKKYKLAYQVASEHSLTAGADFAAAEWLAGWVSLTFLNTPEYSITHFENFYNNVGYPISLARGAYWIGKTYQVLGDNTKAEKFFKEGSIFLTTYYGQLSYKEISNNEKFTLKDQSQFNNEYEKEFNKNKLIRHVILLSELNQTQYTKDILKHLASLNIEEGSEVLAAKLATSIGRYDFAIQISKQASYQKRFYNKFNYPIIATPRKINGKVMPKPEFILSIIRQESEFDAKANSYAGARGMMQLMKYTAKVVAKKANLKYSISGLTKDPEYNIKLGSFYFNSLLEDYNGIYPFAIAAYNAGPNRVKTWRRVNGDPAKSQLSYVDWIELIRFKETRNYVQRVLENVNVYKYMLNQSPVSLDNFFRR